ncbi:MAG: hypothetical protein JWO04_3403 [Gammaproteobacteria bacterium]|nr:hypothetical protein [Gammaproteobacteria bacterium]
MTIKVVAHPAKLAWRNFKPVAVVPDSDEDAQVAPEATLPGRVGMQKVKGKFRLADSTVTVAPKSTETLVVRTANKTADLLEHEQGHYELMILSARAMAAELEKLEADSAEELQSAVTDVQSTHASRADAVDHEYDRQTDHSRNVAQQRRWRKLIDQAMASGNASSIDGNDL